MISHGASLSLETIHPKGWFWLLVFMFVCFCIRQSSKGSDHIHVSVPRVPLGPQGPCTGFAFNPSQGCRKLCVDSMSLSSEGFSHLRQLLSLRSRKTFERLPRKKATDFVLSRSVPCFKQFHPQPITSSHQRKTAQEATGLHDLQLPYACSLLSCSPSLLFFIPS